MPRPRLYYPPGQSPLLRSLSVEINTLLHGVVKDLPSDAECLPAFADAVIEIEMLLRATNQELADALGLADALDEAHEVAEDCARELEEWKAAARSVSEVLILDIGEWTDSTEWSVSAVEAVHDLRIDAIERKRPAASLLRLAIDGEKRGTLLGEIALCETAQVLVDALRMESETQKRPAVIAAIESRLEHL